MVKLIELNRELCCDVVDAAAMVVHGRFDGVAPDQSIARQTFTKCHIGELSIRDTQLPMERYDYYELEIQRSTPTKLNNGL